MLYAETTRAGSMVFSTLYLWAAAPTAAACKLAGPLKSNNRHNDKQQLLTIRRTSACLADAQCSGIAK
jgi:hypothetical protein